MLRFIIRRLLVTIPTILVVITITWALIKLAPGNFYTGEKRLPAAIEKNIREKYGLDKPWYEQYRRMIWPIIRHRDFGTSLKYQGPVSQHHHRSVTSRLGCRWNPRLYTRINSWYHCRIDRGAQAEFALGLFIDGSGDAGDLSPELCPRTNSGSDLFADALLVAALTLGWLPKSKSDPSSLNALSCLHGLHSSVDAGGNVGGFAL